MQNSQLKGIPYIRKIGYATGNLGFGVVFQVIVSYLVFYATVVLKIPAGIVGILAGAGVIWDAVTDPVMGYISDNTNLKRFGRRHLYLLLGGFGAALFNYLLWGIHPELPQGIKILWLVTALILIKSALTVFSTPHVALGAELSNDYDERTSIQGLRTIFFLLAIFLVAALFMLLFFKETPQYPKGLLNPEAYKRMGAAASVLVIISSLIAFYSTRKYIPFLMGSVGGKERNAKVVFRIFAEFKTAFKNRNFLFIVLGYLCTNITTALFTGIGLHVYTYTFGFDNVTISLLLGSQMLTSVVSQPVWVYISKKIDKKPSVILGLAICIISCLLFIGLVLFRIHISDDIPVFVALSILLGFGSGVLFSLPMSMIADTIDIEELETGRRSEGVYYGLLTFCYKMSQSFVLISSGVLLDAIMFDPELMVQLDFTELGLGMILSIGSLAGLILGVLSYSGYNLDRREIKKVQDALMLRRGSGGTDSSS